MQSTRRKDLVYNNVSTSVLEHDEDFDAEQLRIGDKFVYKGTIDPQYTEHGLDVQWLYDDSSDYIQLEPIRLVVHLNPTKKNVVHWNH